MIGWKKDKKWSDVFIPEIKGVLGNIFICEPVEVEDQMHNTDLTTLDIKSHRVGCRIRKNNFFERYPDEFTIRCSRPSGQETELTKIIAGWGDYFFYGFSDEEERHLVKWAIGDLSIFRVSLFNKIYLDRSRFDRSIRGNNDNSSRFASFRWDEFPKDFIVASSEVSYG